MRRPGFSFNDPQAQRTDPFQRQRQTSRAPARGVEERANGRRNQPLGAAPGWHLFEGGSRKMLPGYLKAFWVHPCHRQATPGFLAKALGAPAFLSPGYKRPSTLFSYHKASKDLRVWSRVLGDPQVAHGRRKRARGQPRTRVPGSHFQSPQAGLPRPVQTEMHPDWRTLPPAGRQPGTGLHCVCDRDEMDRC